MIRVLTKTPLLGNICVGIVLAHDLWSVIHSLSCVNNANIALVSPPLFVLQNPCDTFAQHVFFVAQ